MVTYDSLITKVVNSGWNTCPSIKKKIIDSGLETITKEYLFDYFPKHYSALIPDVLGALNAKFRTARFFNTSEFGLLLIPSYNKIDTRGALDQTMRTNQFSDPKPDFIDPRLPSGKTVKEKNQDWSLVITITGISGLHFGSYHDIWNRFDSRTFSISGIDTREWMIRQVWGARLLQSGTRIPDSDLNDNWTFSLFPGEDLVEGKAASATVLFRTVRFRLGNPTRSSSPVRICPAVPLNYL